MKTSLFVSVAVFGLLAGCANESPPKVTSKPQMVVVQGAATTTYILGQQPKTADQVSAILARTVTSYEWQSVEIPNRPDGAPMDLSTPVTFDLKDPTSGVVFSSVYETDCNRDALKPPKYCTVVEKYTSGEANLSGSITIGLTDTSAQTNMYVAWEGMTDRFGLPERFHKHATDGSFSVGVTDIVRVNP